jgi:small conductance mechanosensitive channel
MLTGNNQTVFVPNGALSNGTIINYSMQGERRADLTFAVSYDSDIKKAKDILLDVLNNNPKVLKMPVPEVFVKNLTTSSVEFAVRPWATNANYGAVFSETLENCKTALDEAGIAIQPFTIQK